MGSPANDRPLLELPERRIAKIYGTMFGSGYAVTPNLLLTAKHVVGDLESTCTVWPEIGGEHTGTVVWCGKDNYEDTALVAVQDSPWHALDDEVVWAELRGMGKARCSTLGYPWADRENEKRHLSHETWRVSAITYRELGSYRLDLDPTPPKARPADGDKKVSAWGGLSGGPLLSADGTKLLGVVRGERDNYPGSALGAIRVSELLGDFQFSAFVRASKHDLDFEYTAAVTPAAAVLDTDLSGPDGLLLYRVPDEWCPDGRSLPVGSLDMADLGAWVCLQRGPSTSVVAAAPGIDFSSALNRLEDNVIRLHSSDVIQRRWHGVDARITLPDREHDLLRLRGHGAAASGAGLGLLLDWTSAESAAQSARECRNRVRQLAPQSGLVFVVTADLPVDAVATACALARELGSGQGAESVDVFARLWFEGADAGTGVGAPPLMDGDQVAHRLMAGVWRAMRRRGLPTPPEQSTVEPLPAETDPVEVADAVVGELNAVPVWGGPLQESASLLLVRDYQPQFFPALIQRHAALRVPPANAASLHAAMTLDKTLDTWLSAVPAPESPARIPTVLRETKLVDSVLLAMIRAGVDEHTRKPWTEYAANRRTPAGKLAAWLDQSREVDLADFLSTENATAGIAAHRAGLVMPRTLAAGSAAWWAFLGRAPVSASTVTWLAGLGTDTRRIAGFTNDPELPDIELAEVLLQLRTSMRPPVPPWEATT